MALHVPAGLKLKMILPCLPPILPCDLGHGNVPQHLALKVSSTDLNPGHQVGEANVLFITSFSQSRLGLFKVVFYISDGLMVCVCVLCMCTQLHHARAFSAPPSLGWLILFVSLT